MDDPGVVVDDAEVILEFIARQILGRDIQALVQVQRVRALRQRLHYETDALIRDGPDRAVAGRLGVFNRRVELFGSDVPAPEALKNRLTVERDFRSSLAARVNGDALDTVIGNHGIIVLPGVVRLGNPGEAGEEEGRVPVNGHFDGSLQNSGILRLRRSSASTSRSIR